MSDGTVSRDLTKLASDQERIGTRIDAFAGMDSGAIAMSVLASHADKAMDLLADVAEHPAFRLEDVERDRKQRLVRIAQEADNVGSMADRKSTRLNSSHLGIS